MPKSIPSIGQQNWGQTLNNHLSQLQNPTNGGLNSGTTAQRPTATTLNAGDGSVGYTYLDTTTKELLKWNGTGWDVLLKENTNLGAGDVLAIMLVLGQFTNISEPNQRVGITIASNPFDNTDNFPFSNPSFNPPPLNIPDGTYRAFAEYVGVASFPIQYFFVGNVQVSMGLVTGTLLNTVNTPPAPSQPASVPIIVYIY